MRLISLSLVAALLATPVLAATEGTALMSPKCDAAKLKSIGGDAVVKIEPGAAKDIYNVTFDKDKISSQDLSMKVIKAGCM